MVRLFGVLLTAAAVSGCGSQNADQEEEAKILKEAHTAVEAALGFPEKPVFSNSISFVFPRRGLVCGTVRASSTIPEQVYAYSRTEGAVVGHSILYGEIYGRCLTALGERDEELRAQAKVME